MNENELKLKNIGTYFYVKNGDWHGLIVWDPVLGKAFVCIETDRVYMITDPHINDLDVEILYDATDYDEAFIQNEVNKCSDEFWNYLFESIP